jgi:hypothetical protein
MVMKSRTSSSVGATRDIFRVLGGNVLEIGHLKTEDVLGS